MHSAKQLDEINEVFDEQIESLSSTTPKYMVRKKKSQVNRQIRQLEVEGKGIESFQRAKEA